LKQRGGRNVCDQLHILKPSVNNMTARVFIRAAKLDFTEDDVYGKTRTDELLAKNPTHLTPIMEARRASRKE
jgi:glutathione S-transferase